MADSAKESSFQFDKIKQPFWSPSEPSEGDQAVLTGVFYKLTRVGIVVRRGVGLFKDRCTTYHNPDLKTDATNWMLDRGCTLIPALSSDLTSKRRGIRPKGTWAITAVVQGVQSYIDLYEVTVDWPPSWAAAGYTSLVLGFPERQEAARWHDALSGVLAGLKAGKGQSTVLPLAHAGTTDLGAISTPVAASDKASGPVSSASDIHVRSGDASVVQVPERQAASMLETPVSQAASMLETPVAQAASVLETPVAQAASMLEMPLSREEAAAAEDAAAVKSHGSTRIAFAGAPSASPPSLPQPAASGVGHAMWDENDMVYDSEDDEAGGEAEGDDDGLLDEQRWVPYRQTNGVAIYYHAAEGKQTGGEYMVSSIIRGRPATVAGVLMRLRGNTTILGPVAAAEVLQPEDKEAAAGKEVLRLVLTASGSAGYFCAPREIILERMRKEEDNGVTVILFKSVDLPNEANSQAPSAGLYGQGLYKRPVRGTVAGGYTIAGLRGEGAASNESLVTCILRADLGGVCSSGSWAQPLASLAGWTDAFLDRILMSVNLLRDEVEQRRFILQPFKMVASAKARFNQEGALVGGSKPQAAAAPVSAAGSAASGPSASRLVSTIGRPTARMASIRVCSSAAAAALHPTSAVPATAGGLTAPESSIPEEEAVAIESGPLDIERARALALMPRKYWTEVQVPGTDAPFHVRGPTYLKDRKKVLAGPPAFQLGSLNLVELPPPGTRVAGGISGPTGVVDHVSRFLPAVRQSGAPFSIIINLVVPGSPMLSLVTVFCTDKHPSILGAPPERPMEEAHDWQPFDFVLHKFVYGSDDTRNNMLKLVPHIAEGSWMIKQSVGTTPVIMGKALKTTYHCTPTYIEVDIDISANSVANYVTGMVRGTTASLAIDLAFVLEGKAPWELPECLLGCFRLNRLDCKAAMARVDWERELPMGAAGGSKL